MQHCAIAYGPDLRLILKTHRDGAAKGGVGVTPVAPRTVPAAPACC